MADLRGKTNTIKRIKENRDLALWQDITQTNTNKHPKDLYITVLEYIKSNNVSFKAKSYDLIRYRYGECLDYIEIGKLLGVTSESVRIRILRILRDLSKLRRHYVNNIYIQTKPKEKSPAKEPATKEPAAAGGTWKWLEELPTYNKKQGEEDVKIKEYADKSGYSYSHITKTVQNYWQEVKELCYAVNCGRGRYGKVMYLTPQAITIIEKYLVHPHKKAAPKPKQVKQPAAAVKTENTDLLTVRAQLAAAMVTEKNEKYKAEYYKVLKDLNEQ